MNRFSFNIKKHAVIGKNIRGAHESCRYRIFKFYNNIVQHCTVEAEEGETSFSVLQYVSCMIY